MIEVKGFCFLLRPAFYAEHRTDHGYAHLHEMIVPSHFALALGAYRPWRAFDIAVATLPPVVQDIQGLRDTIHSTPNSLLSVAPGPMQYLVLVA